MWSGGSAVEDRRNSSRYPIECPLAYRVLSGKKPRASGVGRTVNISSHGVLICGGSRLHEGGRVKLWIDWPVALDDGCRLSLVVTGRVIRSEQRESAIRILKHEFRTQASRRLERKGPEAVLPVAGSTAGREGRARVAC